MGGIVIIGAGQAGTSLAAKLRMLGYQEAITLIGKEPVPPYQRPPLSKGYLLGDIGLERLYLRAPSYWEEQGVTLRLGSPVTAINRTAKFVRVDGECIPYDQLALTTGSRPRQIPTAVGGDLAGVYTVRTLADVDAMAPEFQAGRRLLVVGGGYIGLEAAAVGAKLGLNVTLIEMASRILQRVAAPETSDYFRRLHNSHGVRILESMGLVRLTGENRVSGVVLSDGSERPVDFVIVGIGITPMTFLAEEAGLEIDNGIRTDELGRSSDPHIWAAGDCASFPYKGGRIRLESVGNAIDQAETVAENMLGAGKAYKARPWFWSDQYDVKLQIAGLNTGYDHIAVRVGEGVSASFWYYRNNQLLAVDVVNDVRAYMIGKRLIEAGRSPNPAIITDTKADLHSLLKLREDQMLPLKN
ncbi:3-phenylpropionate/trans-cinnamate dioxygenase ferredoxin reductase subunit [Paracoccus alcaliphilus]|uniref:3-phenylpropionate/trans-cinnamate dioxygenase ferredoxin reductase subunit n=1 Tax=Paracoccus alcaliphilus TaxID=34002 RepID=A0A1H8MMG3_9RHOB|nr:FAD/NAD(P)-binding oxidoreductase [Paracoccus alcaliphilus]WCR21100.1 NAD(P)/FAD-dependent oxidoreductase [Paracoccus alcaliphilus]SEO18499.1 3-phenylpropionate/trans-cinnamate dioxygenase ferredoxin reductase subunit [Paracoccus alcaliphilus]